MNEDMNKPAGEPLPEVWLRGPVEGVPGLLQPVAHALLQAVEEIEELMKDFPDHLLGSAPGEVATPAFHLQHMTGVLDRLSTYARGEQLNEAQMAYLRSEGQVHEATTTSLVQHFTSRVHAFIEDLKKIEEDQLRAFRGVGRKSLPSTVQGLHFHAAEHTMRHLGQLLVTVKCLKTADR
jgi:hypothetical protein